MTKIECLPKSNWLAELLSNECFIICSQSCKVIVNGTMSYVTKSSTSSKKKSAMRQQIAISKQDMAHYQSIGYHSISIAYELVLRMHATDYHYQSDKARGRITGIFVSPIIENTVQSTLFTCRSSGVLDVVVISLYFEGVSDCILMMIEIWDKYPFWKF